MANWDWDEDAGLAKKAASFELMLARLLDNDVSFTRIECVVIHLPSIYHLQFAQNLSVCSTFTVSRIDKREGDVLPCGYGAMLARIVACLPGNSCLREIWYSSQNHLVYLFLFMFLKLFLRASAFNELC